MRFTPHGPFWIVCLFVVTAAMSAWAADGPESVKPLRSIDAIRKLSYDEARMGPPVILRVTVTSHLSAGFDGQDNTGGMFFEVPGDQIPRLSESVEIYGNVTGGFYGPYVVVDEIKRHGGTGMPRPLNFRPDFIQTGIGDNRWIEIEGLLVSVDFDEESRSAGQGLLVTGENDLTIRFRNKQSEFDVKRLERMVGSWVKLRGTGAPLFNDRRQRIGSDIVCSSHKNVELVEQQKKIPEVTLDEIGRWDSKRTKPGLVQTVAKVTLVEDARTLVAQSGEFGARVQTLQPHEVALGDEIVFTGLPKTEGFFVGLRYASLAAAEEQTDPVEAIADPDPFSRSQAMRLVKVKGRLIEQQGRLLSLQLEDQILPVRLPKNLEAASLPTIGSEIEVTGVKLVDADERGQLRSVTLAARTGADIDILQIPSWWTPQRYFIAILALLAVFILSLFWTLALKRRVEKQTALIESQLVSNAALEERNRIARELHDTLSQGFSGVGYQLASVKNHIESDPEKAKGKLDLARQMVEHSLAEARDSLSGLRIPAAADSLNFPDTTIAIARERCEEAELRLIVHHTLGAERLTLDAETAYACHRILLEAVMNAIRHSGGDSIGIATGRTDEELVFCVSDNGHGFDPAIKPAGHFGILGMQERAKEIEAALSVDTSEEGTRLNLTLPVSLS